jgi:NAD-dependent dihydropyrimidine dehydrogenase PreA subunit
MPGIFIDVKVEQRAASDATLAAKLAEVCPVGIFEVSDGRLRIVEKNLDECVLCDLCIDAAPQGTVQVLKLYEESSHA